MRRHEPKPGFGYSGVSFEADPSPMNRPRLASAVGAKRFAYNWALAMVRDQLQVYRTCYVLALRQGARREEAERWAEDVAASGGYDHPWAYRRRLAALEAEGLAGGLCALDAKKLAKAQGGGDPWSAWGLRKTWNAHKHEVAPWWAENSKESYSSAFSALSAALSAYWGSKRGDRKGPAAGFPCFKHKGDGDSLTYTTGSFGIVDAHHVRVPRLGAAPGQGNLLRIKDNLSGYQQAIADGELVLHSFTISVEPSGRYRCAFGVEKRLRADDRKGAGRRMVRGYDVGISRPLTVSDGSSLSLGSPRGMAMNQRRANLGLVAKTLGVSWRSPDVAAVMDAVGTHRVRDGRPTLSMSKAALGFLAEQAGSKQADSPEARLAAVACDVDLLGVARQLESSELAEASARRERRRARRLSRVRERAAEKDDQQRRQERLGGARRHTAQARRAKTEAAKESRGVGVPAFDRGLALPDPERLARTERRRARWDRKLSRQREAQREQGRQAASGRYRKARTQRARAFERQRDARKDFAHKATSREASRTVVGVAETIDIKALMSRGGAHKRGLNRALGTAGLGMILRFLDYKLARAGGVLLRAPKFYPSTKRCSDCEAVKDSMPLSERTYRCENCHAVFDRDDNASRNLKQVAGILALLGALVAVGAAQQSDYDKMIDSWSLKASGPVGSTTKTARGAERLQPHSTSGAVLRGETRSPSGGTVGDRRECGPPAAA